MSAELKSVRILSSDIRTKLIKNLSGYRIAGFGVLDTTALLEDFHFGNGNGREKPLHDWLLIEYE